MPVEQGLNSILAVMRPDLAYIAGVIAICALALFILHERINPARKYRRRLAALGVQPAGAAASKATQVSDAAGRLRGPQSRYRDRMLRMSALKDPAFRRYLGLGIIVFPLVTLMMLFVGGSWIASLMIGGAFGLGGAWLYRGQLLSRRRALIASEFPAAIDTMVRSLRSGLTLTDTFRLIAEEASPAIAAEFRRIEMEREIGLSIPEVMTRFAERMPLQEIKYFVTIVNLQSVTGSSLADTLNTLSDTLRQRRILKEKIISMTADARSSALIIGALPFIVIAALLFLNPDYLSVFYTTVSGKLIISGAAIYMCLGFFIMKEMVKFDA
jgi:tight adherence protein B